MVPPKRRARLRYFMLRQRDVGLAHPIGSYRLIIKFAGNDAGFAQLLGPIVIELRLFGLRISQRQSGLRGIDLGKHLIDGLLGARELRLGLTDADLEIAGIEGHQQIAALYRPVVLDIDRRHGSGDPSRDQRDGSIDIGVIGGDVGGEIVVVTNRGKDADDDHHDYDGQQCPAQPGRFHNLFDTPRGGIRSARAPNPCLYINEFR